MGKLAFKPAYRRNLPHIQPPGATLFVTFRLAGSLPQSVIDRWNEERKWLKHLLETNPVHYEKVKLDFERGWFRKFETILDRAESGPIWLLNNAVATQVAESLHHRDGKVAAQGTVVDPSDEYYSLASIMQSLKGYTAFRANRILNRKGEFWAHESFDHYVRDADEWNRIVRYVINNPVKSGLVENWRDWKWTYLKSDR